MICTVILFHVMAYEAKGHVHTNAFFIRIQFHLLNLPFIEMNGPKNSVNQCRTTFKNVANVILYCRNAFVWT